MGMTIPIEIPVLSGLIEGAAPTRIADNQFAQLNNMYPFAGRLKQRLGYTKITLGGAGSERYTNLARFQPDADHWYLLAGALTGVDKLVGDTMARIPVTDGQVYTSQTYAWTFAAVRGVMYAARKNTGTMKRILSDYMQDAGIAAPSSAPTIADGGAGDMDAGAYIVVVTFRNSDTGAESNASLVSNTLTQAGSKQIDVSGVPVSTNGQVNQRRIWITLPDETEEYFLAGTIDDNFSTTITINVTQDDLGDQLIQANAVPPPNMEKIAFWQSLQRMIGTDGTDIFYSEPDMPESWDERNLITVNPEDGNRVTALYDDGVRFIVGKTNSIFYLAGTGTGNLTRNVLSTRHGIVSNESVKSADGLLFFLGPDREIYRSVNGGIPEPISTVAVRNSLDAIPDSELGNAYAEIHTKQSLYMLFVAQTGGGTNHMKAIVYNYKTDEWCTFTFAEYAPAAVAALVDSSSQLRLFMTLYNGHVYYLFEGNSDDGTNISVTWLGKAFSKGGALIGCRRVGLDCNAIPASAEVRVYHNEDTSVVAATRTVSLNQTSRHKMYNLSSVGTPASTIQFNFQYSNPTHQLVVDSLYLDLVDVGRRAKII